MIARELQPQIRDVIIIGGGPVGLFSAFMLGMLGLSPCILEALDNVGGQSTALYPEKFIYDLPGFSKIQGRMLVENLYNQIASLAPCICLGSKATKVSYIEPCIQSGKNKECEEPFFLIATEQNGEKTEWKARSLVIATGGGMLIPNRPHNLQGIEFFEKKSIFYNIQKVSDFAGKSIVVAGGGDSAIGWAIELSAVAEKVFLVHRREDFKCLPHHLAMLESLKASNGIEIIVPCKLCSLIGDRAQGHLREVVVEHADTLRHIKADIFLPFFGLSREMAQSVTWDIGILAHKEQIKVDSTTMQTNVPGVFAVGDAAKYENKLRRLISGFFEATTAAYAVHKFLYPDKMPRLGGAGGSNVSICTTPD